MESKPLRVKLAELLEKNCRLSHAEIAQMLAVDERHVSDEIAAMEKSGIIVRYGARINWDKLGGEARVFATIGVQVTPEREVGFDGVARRIVRFPEVHSMYLISGGHDFEVVVEGSNMRDVAYFVAQRLAVIPGVRSTATQFVLQTYKLDGDIRLDADEDERLLVSP